MLAGDRLAKIMDGKRTLLHANHGVIVCTETIAEAFDYLYYLEKACEITVKAMSTGRPLKLIAEPVCKHFHAEMEPPHLVQVRACCAACYVPLCNQCMPLHHQTNSIIAARHYLNVAYAILALLQILRFSAVGLLPSGKNEVTTAFANNIVLTSNCRY